MSIQPTNAAGSARTRVDGRLKVTGQAPYAADHRIDGVLHAVIVDATVGYGRVTAVDSSEALRQPGVRAVISHVNAPRLPYRENTGSNNPEGRRLRVFQDDRVLFFGQPVAVVVADTIDTAHHAAGLVAIRYDDRAPTIDLMTARPGTPTAYSRGDSGRTLSTAPVQMSMDFRMARNHHNPMEPHATVAQWEGDRLTLWDKTQWVGDGTQVEVAAVFGIPESNVHVISPFVGGGFGSGLRAWPHVTVAAMAARETRRPVKLELTRRQMYFGTGYRPAYDYRLRLGSTAQGLVTAMEHDILAETATYENFTESVLAPGQMLYDTADVTQSYSTVALNVNAATYMRGPGYATAAFAIETAMDELAVRLDIDPIELRQRNEPASDRSSGLPFSTRRLRECYTVGAREFGWEPTNRRPGTRREGDLLIGTGMATAVYDTARLAARAHARINADGTASVQSATSDMGPGTYTSMTQVAADALGIPMSEVTFSLGDSRMPSTPPHGGSMTMASVGSAVQNACDGLRDQAIAMAVRDPRSPLHQADPSLVIVLRGRLQLSNDATRGETYRELLGRNGRRQIEVIGSFAPPETNNFSLYSYGAVFAEVSVDSQLGVTRVRRMLGVYDAGRIINPTLADSQAIGGMVGGIGKALLEHTTTDQRDGRIVNANLADYLVPVHADITDLRAIYLNGDDRRADPIGVKGLGEIVMVGIAPAIGNAVFNATGRRVRELPIGVESLL
ncbi:xanthine dehydrogenase family protein molybdopterin-binding subunit [Williamsia sp. M5A3_1d]